MPLLFFATNPYLSGGSLFPGVFSDIDNGHQHEIQENDEVM